VEILCWNVRGINSQIKLTTIRSKILETNCEIIYLQETKRENFDQIFIRQFFPSTFDRFKFIPSVGASGGTIMIWKSSRFNGQVISQNDYAMSVEFESMLSGAVWILTNVYALYTPEGKIEFMNWLHDFVMSDDTDCLLVGDFNLIRKPSDQNRPGGNVQEMFRFNEVISHLRLEELPLQGN
jgi:exonuclease III